MIPKLPMPVRVMLPLLAMLATTPASADLSAGLLAYWSFDAGTAADDTGNGFDGTIIGGVAPGPGVEGLAMEFSGSESYIEVVGEALGVTPSQPRTISMWVNVAAIDHPVGAGFFATGLISKYRHFVVANSDYYSAFTLTPSGQIIVRITGQGTDVLDLPAEHGFNDWQHYVFELAAGPNASAIYQNGQLLSRGTLSYTSTVSTEPLRIGTILGAGDQAFEGLLDEIRIYDRLLTSQEIEELAKLCSYGPPDQPREFVRSKRKPVFESLEWESCGGPGTLEIASDGVSSALVYLNGDLLLGPSDFSGGDQTIIVPIELEVGNNTVDLQLRGSPRSALTLTLNAD